jgi:hypothetical protein
MSSKKRNAFRSENYWAALQIQMRVKLPKVDVGGNRPLAVYYDAL